jgi:hypothetical protein
LSEELKVGDIFRLDLIPGKTSRNPYIGHYFKVSASYTDGFLEADDLTDDRKSCGFFSSGELIKTRIEFKPGQKYKLIWPGDYYKDCIYELIEFRSNYWTANNITRNQFATGLTIHEHPDRWELVFDPDNIPAEKQKILSRLNLIVLE